MKPLQITFEGHLTKAQVHEAFAQIETDLEGSTSPPGLIVDCSRMTGYDSDARSAFIEMNKKWRKKVRRVAIVTDNILWHMVIKMMSKVSSQEMREFTNVNEAQDWAQG